MPAQARRRGSSSAFGEGASGGGVAERLLESPGAAGVTSAARRHVLGCLVACTLRALVLDRSPDVDQRLLVAAAHPEMQAEARRCEGHGERVSGGLRARHRAAEPVLVEPPDADERLEPDEARAVAALACQLNRGVEVARSAKRTVTTFRSVAFIAPAVVPQTRGERQPRPDRTTSARGSGSALFLEPPGAGG